MTENFKLQLQIATSGSSATVADLKAIQKAIADTTKTAGEVSRLAAALGVTADQAKSLAEKLKLSPEAATQAIESLRLMASAGINTNNQMAALSKTLGISKEQFKGLSEAINPRQGGLTAAVANTAALAFQFNQVTQAVQSLAAAARPAYEFLIGSNERLNAQLLSSQSNLASGSKISQGGQEITDPTAKIKATEGVLRQALKQIEIDTQALVGVTSAQVNELFQITLTNAASLNNQSKQFPDAIAAATSLTKGWAASLKVVGVPLFQARQEINSILQGTIDQNSVLAKNLKITNDQVIKWKSQGTLVDEINKRLQTFVAGNAIAARSVDGISSNIQDLIERLGRVAGEPLLEPVIASLAEIEKFLKANEEAITYFFGILVEEALKAGTTVFEAFAPAGKTLLDIGGDLGPIAIAAIKGLSEVFVTLAQVLGPIANLTLQIIQAFSGLASTDLGGIAIQAGIITVALAQLTQVVAVFAATALPSLWAAALTTATAMGSLYAGLVGVATGNTALALTSPAVVAALNAITAAALPLAAALLPLAAGTGLAVLVRQTRELGDTNDTLGAYTEQVLDSVSAVGRLSGELERLKKARENGTATAAQLDREKVLITSARLQLETINEQVKNLKEVTGLTAEQTRTRDAAVATLQNQAEKLQKVTGGLKLESIELQNLGTLQEQFRKKLENAQRQVRTEANGDPEAFKKAAGEIVTLAKAGVDAKQLTVEAAREQLEAVKNNTKVEFEVQKQAKEAIAALIDGRIGKIKELVDAGGLNAIEGSAELERIKNDTTLELSTRRKAAQQLLGIRKETIAAETAAITAGQAEIALLQARQAIGEAKADKETTRLKIEELKKRQEATAAAIANATNDTERQKLLAEQRQGQAELEKLQAEFDERDRRRAVEAFDKRRALLQAQKAIGLVSQQQANREILANDLAQIDLQLKQQQESRARLSADDIAGRQAADAKVAELITKRRQTEKTGYDLQIQQLREAADQELKIIQAARDTQQITSAEFSRERLQNRLTVAEDEIAQQTANLGRLGKADVEGRKQIEARIAELRSARIAALDQSFQDELDRIQRFQSQATALLQLAENERSVLVQKAVNAQVTRSEAIEQQKLINQRASLDAQFAQAQAHEAALAKLAGETRSPQAQRQYEEQVRSARLATAQLTLRLLEQENQQIQFNRQQAIKAIEDRAAATNRAAEAVLLAIKTESAERDRSQKALAAQANQQTADLERVSKAIGLQNDLLKAQVGLAQALRAASQSDADRSVDRVRQAIELSRQLQSGTLSEREAAVARRQLQALVGSTNKTNLQLVKELQAAENEAAARKRESLLFEQEQARVQLQLQQKQQDLALQRQVIEAKIAEIKAKSNILDAQAALNQERINSQKIISAAQAELEKAQRQAPGQERDRAVADAQARLTTAQQEAITNQANAAQQITLATQQADLAKATTEQVLLQQAQQKEINALAAQTLGVQQQTALAVSDAADQARRFAQEMAKAKAEAEALANNLGRIPQGAATPPGRKDGGTVAAGNAYVVGEREPEVFIPNADGVVLNRQQILANLDILAGAVNLPIPTGAAAISGDPRVIKQLQSLEALIASRQPGVAVSANFAAADSAEWDNYLKLQRSIARSLI